MLPSQSLLLFVLSAFMCSDKEPTEIESVVNEAFAKQAQRPALPKEPLLFDPLTKRDFLEGRILPIFNEHPKTFRMDLKTITNAKFQDPFQEVSDLYLSIPGALKRGSDGIEVMRKEVFEIAKAVRQSSPNTRIHFLRYSDFEEFTPESDYFSWGRGDPRDMILHSVTLESDGAAKENPVQLQRSGHFNVFQRDFQFALDSDDGTFIVQGTHHDSLNLLKQTFSLTSPNKKFIYLGGPVPKADIKIEDLKDEDDDEEVEAWEKSLPFIYDGGCGYDLGGNLISVSPKLAIIGDGMSPWRQAAFKEAGLDLISVRIPTSVGHADEVFAVFPDNTTSCGRALVVPEFIKKLDSPEIAGDYSSTFEADLKILESSIQSSISAVKEKLNCENMRVVRLPLILSKQFLIGDPNPINGLLLKNENQFTFVTASQGQEVDEIVRSRIQEFSTEAKVPIQVSFVNIPNITSHGGNVHCATFEIRSTK